MSDNPTPSAPILATLQVAGPRFYRLDLAKPETGDRVTFVPDPNNQYDPNAIKVMKGEHQIGHVPRVQTEQIHQLLRGDLQLEAYITYCDLKGKFPAIIVSVLQG